MEGEPVRKEVRVKSRGAVVDGQKTAYVFEVHYLQSHPFIIKDRFSNIEKLHKTLKATVQGYKSDKEVEFPARNIFTTEFIEKRAYGLEYFFYCIFNNEKYLSSHAVQVYLSMYWDDNEKVNYQYEMGGETEQTAGPYGNENTIKNSPALKGLQQQKLNESADPFDYSHQKGQGLLSYLGNTKQEQYTRAIVGGGVLVCGCCCCCYCCLCI